MLSKKLKNLKSYFWQTSIIYLSFNKNLKFEEFILEISKKNFHLTLKKILKKTSLY